MISLILCLTFLIFPGVFLNFLSVRRLQGPTEITLNNDIFSFLAISFVTSLAIWTVISQIAFIFTLTANEIMIIMIGFCIYSAIKILQHPKLNIGLNINEVCELIVLILLVFLINEPFRYQIPTSDIFSHIAQMSNLKELGFAKNFHGILGIEYPIQQSYSSNPVHLIFGFLMFFDIAIPSNAVFNYNGFLIFLSLVCLVATAKYLLQEHKSLGIYAVGLLIVFLTHSDINSWKNFIYIFETFGSPILPYHLLTLTILPMFVVLWGDVTVKTTTFNKVICLMLFLCLARIHGAVCFWLPWFVLLLYLINSCTKVQNYYLIFQNKYIFLMGAIWLILISTYYVSDGIRLFLDPYDLWTNAGQNYRVVKEDWWILDPASVLKDFWFPISVTLVHICIAHCSKNYKSFLPRGLTKKFQNLLLFFFFAIVAFWFNPYFIKFMIELSSTSVQFYRYKSIFQLILFIMATVSMVLMLEFILQKYVKKHPYILTGIFCLTLLSSFYSERHYLRCLYVNCDDYMDLKKDFYGEPYKTLSELKNGKIAITNEELSGPIAAASNLYPITTVSWRSINDIQYESSKRITQTILENQNNPAMIKEILQKSGSLYLLTNTVQTNDQWEQLGSVILNKDGFFIWQLDK